MVNKQRSDNHELVRHRSLHNAVISTEENDVLRSEAEQAVGELIQEIEDLDDDPLCGPAAGVGLGSPYKGGWGYWQHVRRLIFAAVSKWDCTDEEAARLLGKVYGTSLASLQKSGDMLPEEFKLQVRALENHVESRFKEVEPTDDDNDPLDFFEVWGWFHSGIGEGAKYPRPDLLEIAARVREVNAAKRFAVASVEQAANATTPDTGTQTQLPGVTWPDLVGERNPKPDPKSQDNVRVFLTYRGIKLWRDIFANENRIDGYATEYGDGRMSDTVAERLWLEFADAGCRMDYTLFVRYLGAIAAGATRHPIREYLDKPKWDQTARVEELFIKYLGADDTPLNRAYSRAFMVAAVRRVRQPGCELYGVPILEGFEGGEGKSRFAKTLFGAQYHTDALELGASPKEVLEIASGKWGIEFSELDGFTSNREFSTIKAMTTRTEDRARRAYGRFTSSQPRQFVMIGTTNDGAYLKDRGGLRRFWPITVRPGVLAEKQNRVIGDPVEEWVVPLFESMPKGFLSVDHIKRAFDEEEFDYDRAARSGIIARVARKLGMERSERKIPGTRRKVRGFLKGGEHARGKWLHYRFGDNGFIIDEKLTVDDPDDAEGDTVERDRTSKVVTMMPSKKRIMQQLGVATRSH